MRKTVLSLLNYIGCIGLALFVTLVIDGTIGMVLTFALIIALAVSVIMTVAVRRFVTLTPALDKSAVSKGDKLYYEIKLANSLFLPAPMIEVEIENSAHFSLEEKNTLRGSVTGKGVNTLCFPLTAVHSGKAHIRIKRAVLTDFLGIFSFSLEIPDELCDLTAAIYPFVPDVSVQTSLIKTASRFITSDDEEEESDESSGVPTGLAGYDHREYVPGDPIKRINWKLSSKQDVLMVRLDEKIKGSGRTFLLDCPVTDENDVSLTVRDNVIEGALALLNSLPAEGREAVFYYCKQGLWMEADIRSGADVFTLQEELSDFEPSENAQVIPTQLSNDGKTPICFTAAMNGKTASVEQIASLFPDAMIISSYAASLPVITPNQWVLSDGFELNKV